MNKNKAHHCDAGLLDNIEHPIEAIEHKVSDLILHHHLAHWHPISTVPCNQNLELAVIDRNRVVALPFPCRRTNAGSCVNADLGITVHIEPVRWRVWQNDASSASGPGAALPPHR
jgi:hypothetical protein